MFGGPLCAFAKKYGDKYLTDYQTDGLALDTHSDQGVDGLPHVTELDIFPEDRSTTWTQQQAEHICLPFLPPDAVHQRERDSQDQYGDVTQVYTSAALVATFPSSSSGYDPTGTFTITYVVNVYGVFNCTFEDYA